jgi:hypothetical protein
MPHHQKLPLIKNVKITMILEEVKYCTMKFTLGAPVEQAGNVYIVIFLTINSFIKKKYKKYRKLKKMVEKSV